MRSDCLENTKADLWEASDNWRLLVFMRAKASFVEKGAPYCSTMIPILNGLKSLEKKEPNTLSYIADGKIDLVINIPKNVDRKELDNDYMIRRKAVDFGVPLITNLQLAKRLVEALYNTQPEDLKTKSWDEVI